MQKFKNVLRIVVGGKQKSKKSKFAKVPNTTRNKWAARRRVKYRPLVSKATENTQNIRVSTRLQTET